VWATTWTVYAAETSDNDYLYALLPYRTVRAYSLTNGNEVWRSEAFPSTEYPNNAVPYVSSVVLVDGKLYVCGGYSPSYKINPISRFGMVVCIDAATGENLWTLNGGLRPSSAAAGYVICTGDYDGKLYCIGKGKTATTVTASPKVIAKGSSVLIEGSVMDMSPASPNTPAVSDADMSEWMDYLHMQNAALLNDPPIPDGVTVSISAVDSSGGFTDLGTTTSNYAGQFAISWTPPSEGIYQIFASFAGSDSYYGSYEGTALSVGPATQTPTNGGTQTEPVDNTMLLYGILVAVVIAIIIGLIAIALVLRKR